MTTSLDQENNLYHDDKTSLDDKFRPGSLDWENNLYHDDKFRLGKQLYHDDEFRLGKQLILCTRKKF
jgi:hypothetical protein